MRVFQHHPGEKCIEYYCCSCGRVAAASRTKEPMIRHVLPLSRPLADTYKSRGVSVGDSLSRAILPGLLIGRKRSEHGKQTVQATAHQPPHPLSAQQAT